MFIKCSKAIFAFPERKAEPKKRRKVAKQVILFDEDDAALSSSIPSSCGSILSDNSNGSTSSIKSNDSRSTTDKLDNVPEVEITEEISTPKSRAEKAHIRKLSIEKSGSRDKYPNKLDGTLTPVQSNVGELTPVSVETTNEISVSETVEVSTDISAVLSVVEAKNNEEIKKLQEKIACLTKDNNTLREQLKKYISALQLLNKDDESLQKVIEDLDLNAEKLDYKQEAKTFEKKLVQVIIHLNIIFKKNQIT